MHCPMKALGTIGNVSQETSRATGTIKPEDVKQMIDSMQDELRNGQEKPIKTKQMK